MTKKLIVSAILPAGQAFGKWINEEGGDPGAIPFVAFAAGHKSRDAEVAAADALADWVGWWLSARREEEKSKFTEMRKRLDAYRAARAGQSGPAGGEGQ